MSRTACRALLLVLAGASLASCARVSALDVLRALAERAPGRRPPGALAPDRRPPWLARRPPAGPDQQATDDDDDTYADDVIRMGSKRSAVATALNAGRRRRQPSPALGKAVTPYVGVGVLNDMGSFFDSLRDNLEVLAALSPRERSSLYQDPPSVVTSAQSSGSGGGMRRLHALRPLRPAGNIRSYNRRSLIEPDGGYPGANHHDPGLLWTGLGRR